MAIFLTIKEEKKQELYDFLHKKGYKRFQILSIFSKHLTKTRWLKYLNFEELKYYLKEE